MVHSHVVRHRAICCISTVPEAITVFIDPKQTMHMAKMLTGSVFAFYFRIRNKIRNVSSELSGSSFNTGDVSVQLIDIFIFSVISAGSHMTQWAEVGFPLALL